MGCRVSDVVTVVEPMEAGFLVDTEAKYKLTSLASSCGVTLQFEKLGGWLMRKYAVHITGTPSAIEKFRSRVKAGNF